MVPYINVMPLGSKLAMHRVFIKELNNRLKSENNRLGRGWRGPLRPPLGPGQCPGRVFPAENEIKLFKILFGELSLHLFKQIFTHILLLIHKIKHARIRRKKTTILVSIVFGVLLFLTYMGLLQSSFLFPNLNRCFHICEKIKLGIGSPSQSTFRFLFGVL